MKKTLFALLFGLLGFVTISLAHPARVAAVVDDTPDCDTVAIIRCGFRNESEMRADFNKNSTGDMSVIFNRLGISNADMQSGTFKEGIVWRDGRVTIDGKTVATGAMTAGRWNNPTSDMVRISNTDRAFVMSTSHFTTAGQTALVKVDGNGQFLFAVIKPCGNPVKAVAVKPPKPAPKPPKPAPQPVFSCDNLTAKPLSRTQFQFTAQATAKNGATVKSYTFDFGDNSKAVTTPNATTQHTYAQEGTFTTKVAANIMVNNKLTPVTSAKCVTKVTVAAAPAFECTSLGATLIDATNHTYKFTITSNATSGAQLSSINMDFGDGVITNNIAASQADNITHTYTKTGSFTAQATLVFSVGSAQHTVKSAACSTPITILTPTQPTPPTQPSTLVNTGSKDGLVVLGATTVAIAGYVGHFLYMRRHLQ